MSERDQFCCCYWWWWEHCHVAGNKVIIVSMCSESGFLVSLPVPEFVHMI